MENVVSSGIYMENKSLLFDNSADLPPKESLQGVDFKIIGNELPFVLENLSESTLMVERKEWKCDDLCDEKRKWKTVEPGEKIEWIFDLGDPKTQKILSGLLVNFLNIQVLKTVNKSTLANLHLDKNLATECGAVSSDEAAVTELVDSKVLSHNSSTTHEAVCDGCEFEIELSSTPMEAPQAIPVPSDSDSFTAKKIPWTNKVKSIENPRTGLEEATASTHNWIDGKNFFDPEINEGSHSTDGIIRLHLTGSVSAIVLENIKIDFSTSFSPARGEVGSGNVPATKAGQPSIPCHKEHYPGSSVTNYQGTSAPQVKTARVYCDGAFSFHDKIYKMGVGVVLVSANGEYCVKSFKITSLSRCTNNDVERWAAEVGLQQLALWEHYDGKEEVTLYTDSQTLLAALNKSNQETKNLQALAEKFPMGVKFKFIQAHSDYFSYHAMADFMASLGRGGQRKAYITTRPKTALPPVHIAAKQPTPQFWNQAPHLRKITPWNMTFGYNKHRICQENNY